MHLFACLHSPSRLLQPRAASTPMPPKKPRKTDLVPDAEALRQPACHDPAALPLHAVTAAPPPQLVSPSRKKSRDSGGCVSGLVTDLQPPPSPSFLQSNLLGESGFVLDALNRGLLGHAAYDALLLHRQQQQENGSSCMQQSCTGLCSSLPSSSLLPLTHLLRITRRPVRANLFPQ